MQEKEELLWAESRFSYVFLASVLLFLALVALYIFYPLFAGFPPKYSVVESYANFERMLAVGIGAFVVLLLLTMAVPLFFLKPIKITKRGISVGNKFIVSQEKPSQIACLSTLLIAPFKRSKFLKWSEFKKASVPNVIFRSYYYGRHIGLWSFPSPQKFINLETTAGQRIWVPVGQATHGFNKTNLNEVLQEKFRG